MVSLKCGAWNIRGLNTPLKQDAIKRFMHLNNLVLFAVLETKVREDNFTVFDSFTTSWNLATDKGCARNVRIALLWDAQEVSVVVERVMDQCIHCSVSTKSGDFNGFVSFVYAANRIVS